MKRIMLLSVMATLLLAGCENFSHRGETEVEIPSHDSVVRDQIPDGGRKIPVVQEH